ncbi:MAG: MarR family transcriptional regulator [Chloroflexota bacterium]|nr:MarR family transcriptional regulator [Chloroflexota bacterium]
MAETSGARNEDGEVPLGREARSVRTWVRLARVYDRMVRALSSQVREHGLTLGQFDVLIHVVRSEGLNQQELADQLLVTKGNVSHLVNRLERSGHIERRSGRGRSCHLYPTPAGRDLLAAIVPRHFEVIEDMLSSLSTDQLVNMHQTLRDLDHALE